MASRGPLLVWLEPRTKTDPLTAWGYDNGCMHPGGPRFRAGTDLPFLLPISASLGFGRFTSGDHLPWVHNIAVPPTGPSVHPLGKLDAIWTCFDTLDVKLTEILSSASCCVLAFFKFCYDLNFEMQLRTFVFLQHHTTLFTVLSSPRPYFSRKYHANINAHLSPFASSLVALETILQTSHHSITV